jgi:hypothetical protein
LQRLFGSIAEEAAKESGVIQRKRKFTSQSLAMTFVLGHLEDPDISDEGLAQLAAQGGADVTTQAVEQRYSPRMIKFLEQLFRKATKLVIASDKSMAPILERFSSASLLDSSTITLPDSMKEQFAGCGGSHGGGQAAMKLQTEIDLRSGALELEIEQGRSTDGATNRQHVRRGKGSLRISDLGYFNVGVFAEMNAASEYFLSRLQFGTSVMLLNGEEVELLSWLANQSGPFVDQRILLGKKERLVCRIIAWRVPPEQANRRRQKLRQEMMRKSGKEPSEERLAWCDWTILVTNVPPHLLTPQEAVVMYRARWQVELLFKRWKSQDLVAVLSGSTEVRQMVRVWARLLAALVQHWLVVTSAWGNPTKSLSKVCEAIRRFVGRIAAGLSRINELTRALHDMNCAISKTCRRNKRKKPGTMELLNDVELLDFSLT